LSFLSRLYQGAIGSSPRRPEGFARSAAHWPTPPTRRGCTERVQPIYQRVRASLQARVPTPTRTRTDRLGWHRPAVLLAWSGDLPGRAVLFPERRQVKETERSGMPGACLHSCPRTTSLPSDPLLHRAAAGYSLRLGPLEVAVPDAPPDHHRHQFPALLSCLGDVLVAGRAKPQVLPLLHCHPVLPSCRPHHGPIGPSVLAMCASRGDCAG